jgi:hypothetical protein
MIHAQSNVQLSELNDVHFQRSMSLPRGFGGQKPHPGVHQGPVPPPPRSDSMTVLRNMMARRQRVRVNENDQPPSIYLFIYLLFFFFFFFFSCASIVCLARFFIIS